MQEGVVVSSALPEQLEGISMLWAEQIVEYQEHLNVILKNG